MAVLSSTLAKHMLRTFKFLAVGKLRRLPDYDPINLVRMCVPSF